MVTATGQTSLVSATAAFTVTPAISLSPSTGVAGSVVSPTLTGFGPTETLNVYFQGQSAPVATCTTNGLGVCASIPWFFVPFVPTGTYAVTGTASIRGDQLRVVRRHTTRGHRVHWRRQHVRANRQRHGWWVHAHAGGRQRRRPRLAYH